jgi:hypothetical protein
MCDQRHEARFDEPPVGSEDQSSCFRGVGSVSILLSTVVLLDYTPSAPFHQYFRLPKTGEDPSVEELFIVVNSL